MHLYEYAVIRAVPHVERGERMNIGVILYSRPLRFLAARVTIDRQRLQMFAPGADISLIEEAAGAFLEICAGSCPDSRIAQLDKASRFRWLTAPRSTILQTSRAHPGLCANAEATLEQLHRDLVLPLMEF